MARNQLEGLYTILGREFADRALLEQALTHPSASSKARPDNQRLEFMGDRVLGLCVAEMLMDAFPDLPEGELAPRFNALVRKETLAEVAGEIDLGQYLRLGRSESTSGGRRKAAILADAMEAVIAVLYLDGGLEAAADFVGRHWGPRLRDVKSAPIDAKSALQEWAQGRGLATPSYTLLSRDGPDHAPVFQIEACLDNGIKAKGKARSKKLAEQDAAQKLLEQVNKDG